MDRATTMAIDDLISMQPNAPPPVTDNLARLDKPPSRLSILGKTQNIGRLADFPSVEALWVGDVNERQFNEILPLIDPLYLLFDGLRVADLASLGRLRRLQAIEIRWNTKVTDVSFLENLTNLRLLALSHCPKVHDLSPIAALKNLEILDLSGGMWSTFKPDTLEPLGQLRNLRGLSLKAIRVKDQSLAPVARLKQLQELELSNQFPTEEYARLSVALPHIQCTHFSPYLDFGAGEDANQVMVTGKGKPVLSLPKDAARLERYVQRFREMQESFRAEQE
jgi:hypothetical protein